MTRQKDIIDEKDVSEDLIQVDSAPIMPSHQGKPQIPAPGPFVGTPPQLGSYYEGSLPSDMQRDGFFVRTGYQSPQAATFSLMPVAQLASSNAATQGIAQIVVNEAISKIVFPESGLRWRGDWTETNVYSTNDIVQFNISTYIALVTNSQVRPDTDTTRWALVSKNFLFDADVVTPGVSGFGPFDQMVTANGDVTPAATLAVPNETSGWALLALSAGAISTQSGWIDFGASFGHIANLVQLKTFTTPNPINTSLSTSGRWSTNLALFEGPGESLFATITAAQRTSNVLTVTCTSSFIVGTRVTFSSMTGAFAFLNATTLVITSNTGTALTFASVGGDIVLTVQTGLATNKPFLQAKRISNNISTGSFMATFDNVVAAGSTILVIGKTTDVNVVFTCTVLTDSAGNTYTISNSQNPGPPISDGPDGFVAWSSSVLGGALTLTATFSVTAASLGAPDVWMVEVPGGGSSPSFAYLPYDVFQFRGSFFVCNTETDQDAFDDPASWNIIAQGVGSTVPLFANYQVLLEDWGRLVYNNTTTNWTATLPATIPPDGWMISFQALNTGTLTIARNGLLINGAASDITLVQNQGLILYSDGEGYYTFRGFGTVFSVALSMPSIFSVAGSPITGSGTFTVTLVNQNANLVFAGPASGAAAAPTFRQLVNADMPVGLLGRIAAATGIPGLDGLDGETGPQGPPGPPGPAGSAQAPGFVAVNLLAQTASLGTTTLYAVDASRAGMYRATVDMITTTAGAAGTVTADIIWNNGSAALTQTSATLDLTVLGNEVSMVVDFYSTLSVNISYSFTVVGLVGADFSVRVRLEYLG